MNKVALSELGEADRQFLNASITLEELQVAVASSPRAKAPGIDGLPIKIYKIFGDVLLPELLSIIMEAKGQGRLPQSMYEAIIVGLLKAGKDPTVAVSYRPISLLTTDLKILAKVLAIRLSKVITKLVHPDHQDLFLIGQQQLIYIDCILTFRFHLVMLVTELFCL